MGKFLPLYEKAPGKQGFVSIQADPREDDDAQKIVDEALEDMKLGKNAIAKIPVVPAGLDAIEELVAMDIPVIATEIMGLPQAIAICERYKKASKKSGKTPPFFVTHITGIFDEYIMKHRDEYANIPTDFLWQAGLIVARKQYQIMKERNYPGIMLGGGARGLHHFTELVGADAHVTINWKGTADRLLEENLPVVNRFDLPIPERVARMLEIVPAFSKAVSEDGLDISEFADFGPVQLFRNSFLGGWEYLLAEIEKCK